MGSLEDGESAIRVDDGLLFSSLQDDYCFPVPSHSPDFERLERCHEVYQHMIGQVTDYLNADDDIGQKYILDVGCGTGRWAYEVAQAFPAVNVIGLDLVHSPISHPPDNLTFEIRDILYGLGYEDDCFDVVHIRDIGFGIRDYPALITECARVLRPGGYLVILEPEYYIDYITGDASPQDRCPEMWEYMQALQAALLERGLDPLLGSRIQDHVAFVPGLETVIFERYSVPLTANHIDPSLSYLGSLSTQIWAWFGQSARLLLQDHGPYNSERLAVDSIQEAEDEELYWFFDTGLIRKA